MEDLNRLVVYHRVNLGSDVIVGSRYLGDQHAATWLRHIVGQAYALCVRLATSQTVYDVTSGLKLLNRRAMKVMQNLILEDGHAEFFVFMARAGCIISEVPIQVEERKQGTSM